MREFGRSVGVAILLILVLSLGSGCSFVFHKRSPTDVHKIEELSSEVSKLNEELEELEGIKRDLERKLKGEIGRGQVGLSVGDRGLVVTFVSEILFDSGKAEIRSEGEGILQKIASVLKDASASRDIAVEGHTDNQPIKYSGWKSNWELSTARATSVVHFLVSQGLSPQVLQATGYGEYRPVGSNAAAEGRQRNRRVEIVILPKRGRAAETNFSGRSHSTESIK